MSTILKSKIYTVKSNLLVECAKAMTYRASTDHFVIGGICSVISELLFTTYFIDDKDDDECVYSDAAIVCKLINAKHMKSARQVIWYRNKFHHEFGTEEYYEFYDIVKADMKNITAMCHDIGGLPTVVERAYLQEYFNVDKAEFYDKMIGVFNEYGPVGFKNLVVKLQRKEGMSKGV